MLDLNVFAKEVHENAKDHGWWDTKRSEGEILALIHSEISEALEEYRDARPLVWYECKKMNSRCDCVKDCDIRGKHCEYRNPKPEGMAVELIDCCIRILDFLGHLEAVDEHNKDIDALISYVPEKILNFCKGHSFTDMISVLHSLVSTAFTMFSGKDMAYPLLHVQGIIYNWARTNGLDPEKLLLEKHEYNKTRPYKHGNKVC